MRFSRLAWASGVLLGGLLAGACIASAPDPIHRQTDDDLPDGSINVGDAAPPDAKTDLPVGDPHAVLGAEPSHGPFNGGQRVLVKGNGFTSKVRVWFGDAEADPASIVPIDPNRVQVTAPPGTAGPVDLTAQNGDDESTKRTLAGGYAYDKLYAVPDEGPVSGGTVIEIVGQGTQWDATSVVKIDQKPCTSLTVDSPTSLACTVPQGTPGSKTIAVTTGADTITVLDAYTYEDSDNGFKGGLSGPPLAGDLKVLAFDNFTGDAIPGAHVVAGSDIATAFQGETDVSGVALLSDPGLVGPMTITVAARCHSPITFIDVGVSTVTVYLDPVLSPECASSGDPPPVGGKPQAVGAVSGEIVWEVAGEFKKGPWKIPSPVNDDEKQVAYLFVSTNDPTAPFTLPPDGTGVTPLSPGDLGYGFSMSVAAGNRAVYALAGIEDRTAIPPKFTAYAMGVVRGIPVLPNELTSPVYVPMKSTLDQALSWDVSAPGPGPKGPDRLRATVAIMLGNDGFAILPAGQKTPLLPLQDTLAFVGVPSLGGDLYGSSFLSTARAVTGPTYLAPLSVVGQILTTTTSQPVPVNGFVGVPTLVYPAVNGAWDGTHLETSFPAVGVPIDISVYDIVSGNGLYRWTIAVPKGSHAIEVPDLSAFELAHLPPGPVTIGVYGGRVESFDYDELRYRDMRPQGMKAYSLDYFSSHL